jgi:cell division protein FtsB
MTFVNLRVPAGVAVRRFWLAPAMLAGAFLYAGLDADSGLRTWWQLRQELAASRARVGVAEAEIARLSAAARELDGDPFAMESAIREDLGLARPGETIVLFAGPDSSSLWIP